ncbi:MAG TPA: type II secretion system F family protein [Ktedonobacterales bacterium]|jgi:tight adherence protein C|nr:type II secretion system F family protein [Ktedonobacterales bacterium]
MLSSPFLLAALAGLLAFFGVFLAVAGVASSSRKNPLDQRLKEFANRPQSLAEIEMQAPFGERFLRPFVGGIAGFVARFTPSASLESTQKRIIHAGMTGRLQAADFFGIKGFCLLVMSALGFLFVLRLFTNAGPIGLFAGIVVGGFAGYYIPDLWLRGRENQRRDQIQRALPDAIDLLTISVEAGLGFDAALSRMVEKADNSLTREFGRVIAEMRVGVARRDALRALVERTGVADLNNFVTAIVQAEQLGASIANVLRIQAVDMRLRRRQRVEVLAHQAPIKMLFPMVFLIFPPLLVVVLGPAIPQVIKVFDPAFPL